MSSSDRAPSKMRVALKYLAVGWLLLVTVWMIWGAATYAGLYRWLGDWQLSMDGEYDAFLVFAIPLLLLAAPAVLVLRYQVNDSSDAPPRVRDAATSERLIVRVLGAIGLVSALLCAGAWVWALRYPDSSGPSVEVDLANLGDAEPPLGRVTLIGTIDGDRVVRKTVDAKGSGGRNLYAPMIVPNATHKTSRIFVEEYLGGAADHPLPTGAGNRFKGVLVEGGLPGSALRQFARLNVDVAIPYYLLMTGRDGARTRYYVAAALCGFVALICLLPLGVLFAANAVRR